MATSSSVIFGCEGSRLTPNEKAFFKDSSPWGMILFARNIVSCDQIWRLTNEFRDCVGWHAPILIDQEGGRVARLKAPIWKEWCPVAQICQSGLAEKDIGRVLWLRYRIIADELQNIGINVNCAPLLDLRLAGADNIIGDRSLGDDPLSVAHFGSEISKGLMAGGVYPVIKHIPGHGRAMVDSHLNLPIITDSIDILQNTDFLAFKHFCNNHPELSMLAMTAHIRYDALDSEFCATFSSKIITEVIRQDMGFNGILMTDDLSMNALQGDFKQRARYSFKAGCDLALHCNGNMNEMQDIMTETPAFFKNFSPLLSIQPFDKKGALDELACLCPFASPS